LGRTFFSALSGELDPFFSMFGDVEEVDFIDVSAEKM
jgi:hypothetical protein